MSYLLMLPFREDTGMDRTLLLCTKLCVINRQSHPRGSPGIWWESLSQCCQYFQFRNSWVGTNSPTVLSHWLGAAQGKCGFTVNEVHRTLLQCESLSHPIVFPSHLFSQLSDLDHSLKSLLVLLAPPFIIHRWCLISNKSKKAIAENCHSTVPLEADSLKGVLRAPLHDCYGFISWKLYRSDLKYELSTMFLLDGSQNFSTVCVNSSHIVII